MVKTALLFVGQGAQAVGMGKALAEAFPSAQKLFDRAGLILGMDLARLCFEGPPETLNRTDVCQPALLVHGLAAAEYLLSKMDLEVVAAAGLSLGEYTALTWAGALAFDEALKLVQKRGRWMQEACDAVESGMVSILGLDRAACEEACRRASTLGIVNVANVNAPGQIVLSGVKEALMKASEKCKELGAKRVIPLKVVGAYHSAVMRPAQEKMQRELANVPLKAPRVPIYANVSGRPLTRPEEIRSALSTQIVSSVLWEDGMRGMMAAGVRRYFECGPGTVLAGLAKRIDETVEVHSIGSPGDL